MTPALRSLAFGSIRALPLVVMVALAACSSPKPLPPSGAAVPGSAPGPVYGQKPAGGWSPQMEAAERQLSSSLSGTGATLARSTDERIWVTLPGDLAFDANRSALKPAARSVLDKVVVAIRNVPNLDVRVVGHTDSKGSAAGNDSLSLDRAAATRDWLVARGLSPVRIAVAGRGSRDPVASNDDEAGRAANRRVELLVGDKSQAATAVK